MAKNTIVIDPVTRIEGHAKISLLLGEDGTVADARFHVNEFRGFEKFCEGRYFTEMTTISPRICGICPASHSITSAKACEQIMRVSVPETATMLRRILHLGQIISSHALSFFHLSSPDLLLGWDSDPVQRNIFGVAETFPDVALKGIRLRKFGQEISERLTGKKIHSAGVIAGGVVDPLKAADRHALRKLIPEAMDAAMLGLSIFKTYVGHRKEEADSYGSFPSLYLGLVGSAGEYEVYDGRIRIVDADGEIIADQLDPSDYLSFVAERTVDWSYLKFPYYKPLGPTDGNYRVGPLARLNVASRMRTPLAQTEFNEFRKINSGKPVQGSFYYHYARLIEVVAGLEQIDELLADDRVMSKDIQSHSGRNQAEGIGCSEAPRGTLFHHYVTDESGRLKKVNLLIATGQNNAAMNQGILQAARHYVDPSDLKEEALNRVEGIIRCYDPCLSCSTHALGAMPLVIEVLRADGSLLNRIQRD